MKYKYIRLKYIIPSVLLIALITIALIFTVGGLKAQGIKYDNIEWSTDGFTSAKEIGEKNLSKNKLVDEFGKYAMVIDETTTIVSIYEKLAGWNSSDPVNKSTAKLLYSSAYKDGADEAKSNFILSYYNSNGKINSVASFAKSVQYENITTGTKERYYSLRYNDDSDGKSIDILYSVGNFTPVVIPQKFSLDDFEEMYIGNTVIFTSSDSEMTTLYDILDSNGNATGKKGLGLAYKPTGYCFSNESAYYILEHNLGKIKYTTDSAVIETLPADPSEILNKKGGYWVLSDILDENGNLKMKMGTDYNTKVGEDGQLLSPIRINPYLTQNMLNYITSDNIYAPLDVYEDGSNKSSKWYYHNECKERILKLASASSTGVLQALYRYLYVGSFQTNDDGSITYDANPYITTKGSYTGASVYFDYNQDGKYTEDEFYQYGGYPARDEAGNYLYTYDDAGNIARSVQMGLQTDQAVAQNEKYNVESEAKTVAFDICLRFKLTSDGVNVTIIHDSINEGRGADNTDADTPSYLKHDNVIAKVELCKYATINANSKSTGQIVLPDGSGAVINFNSLKSAQYASAYPEKRIYGSDMAINQMTRGNIVEKMMLPMYGFLEQSDNRGVVAVVDKGAAQTSISADYLRNSSGAGMLLYNYAYFTTYYRESEKITVTSNSEYIKVSDQFYQGDVSYAYLLLSGSDLTYTDVAMKYRNYLLMDKYTELQDKVDATTVSTPTITFLGAYEKKTFKLGFVYNAEYSLTTFNQAREIIDELNSHGVDSMNVSYRSWTEDEIHQQTTTSVDVSGEVGGKSELIKLSNYLKEIGYNFFPEYKVANGQGYDLAFGALKYSSKSISGSYSNSISYVLSTGLENTSGRRGNFLSPIYYNSLAMKYLKNYTKLNVSGIYLSDLGNKSVSDYSKNIQVYSAGSTYYQQKALQTFNKSVDSVMLNAPYDYAFAYTDVATVIPVQSTLYGSVDYTIPLYQLVVSGLFDYSSKPVNYQNDYTIRWNMLKAIETGSNLSFVLSAEDTNVLLETEYTEYYNSYYVNWKENILYMNDILNSTGIYASRLVNHQYLTDNVVKVTYENGLEIIINYDNENYYDVNNGLSVRSNWFAIVKEGK